MEAIQGNLVEGCVLWLAQSILASLLLDKMEAWLRKVELADDAERLRSGVERVEAVADAVKGKAAGSRPLARSLGRLKELLYDADDLVDELDYFRLQHQVEGGDTFTRANEPEGADESRDNADILGSSSMGSRRSMYWKEFRVTELSGKGKPTKARCIHCDTLVKCSSGKGTSVLKNHLASEACKSTRKASDQQPNGPNSSRRW
ncbi:hypothetical protein ACP4OV_026376 [Aristida adscensionis]